MSAIPARPSAYTNARLLDPATGLDAKGGLLVKDGRIVDLGPQVFNAGIPEDAEVVECGGMCLAPGLVDMRVHLREPGEEHKETIADAGQAAVCGGVTSIAGLPNTEPVIDDVAGVEFVARRAREAKLVKVYPYGTVTRQANGEQMTELGLLAEAGAVAFTDGLQAVANAQMMRRALAYARGFGLLIAQHPAEPTLCTGVMNGGELATRLGLSGIPAAAEVIMIERDLRLVEMTGGRYHAAHVTTAAALDAIREAKARGLPVTCDTAPHYFMLNENEVQDYRTFAKVSPPLRSEMDRRAVLDGLADGTIDAIASDHSAQDQDSKRLPFAQAAFGMVGLESLLPLSLQPVQDGRMDLIDLLRCLSQRPAEILGLEAGCLKAGAPADLVLFDPDFAWRLEPDDFRSKCKNSPFTKHPVQGKVLRTVVDGRAIYQT
ncbi:MAG: dihydroorotase [Rhodovibrionaceae bacterium]|nr:dihydroorotase [Rhodovibrionaceae bacterium]